MNEDRPIFEALKERRQHLKRKSELRKVRYEFQEQRMSVEFIKKKKCLLNFIGFLFLVAQCLSIVEGEGHFYEFIVST